jgi:hypothetical protein
VQSALQNQRSSGELEKTGGPSRCVLERTAEEIHEAFGALGLLLDYALSARATRIPGRKIDQWLSERVSVSCALDDIFLTLWAKPEMIFDYGHGFPSRRRLSARSVSAGFDAAG